MHRLFACLTFIIGILLNTPTGVSAQAVTDDCQQITPYNIETIQEVTQLEVGETSSAMAWSPSGFTLAVDAEEGVSLYDLETIQTPLLLDTLKTEVLSTATRPGAMGIAYSPDGDLLALSLDEVALFDSGAEKINTLEPADLDYAISVAFSPDGNELALLGLHSDIRLWNIATATLQAEFKHEGRGGFGKRILFSPDGTKLADASSKVLTMRDAKTLKVLFSKKFSGLALRDITFNPDGTILVVVDYDGYVEFLDPYTFETIANAQIYEHTAAVTFSPDGKLLVTGSPDRTQFWDTAHIADLSKPLKELTYPGEDTGDRFTVTFSPDGRLLATADLGDAVVHIWGICS